MIVDRICWILVHLFLYCIELEAEHVDDEFNVKELLNMKEFTNAYPAMPCYGHVVAVPPGVNPVMMFGGVEEHGVQQPHVDPEYRWRVQL
jgi:hypothetical protein